MNNQILIHALEYGISVLEALVCVLLVSRGGWRQLKGLCLYVTLLFALDGIGRVAILNYYGQTSRQYANFYWVTDVVLALGAFLLTCGFFRRACVREEKLWRLVRLLLVFVIILVIAISALALTRHQGQLYAWFIIEFSQNLYFSCLVLNTLLYVMIQQFAIEDGELGLLVCGMGIQFAGEAACLALLHLTSGENFARNIAMVLPPACTLGMLSTWVYAILRPTPTDPVRSRARKQAWVEAVAD
ncbi:MAG: hypothetical protein ABSF71_08260 [Terriglobia bacterium]|jgi:hypothetical protein